MGSLRSSLESMVCCPSVRTAARPHGDPARLISQLPLARPTPPLERGGFDDAQEQGGGAAALPLDPLHEDIDGLHVGRPQAAPEGVGQELLAEAAVEVAPMVGDQGALQLPDV